MVDESRITLPDSITSGEMTPTAGVTLHEASLLHYTRRCWRSIPLRCITNRNPPTGFYVV